MRRTELGRLVGAVLLLASGGAAADVVTLAATHVAVDGDRVTVRTSVVGGAISKIAGANIFAVGSSGSQIDPDAFIEAQDDAAAYVAARTGVGNAAGETCARGSVRMDAGSDGDLQARASYDCAGIGGPLVYRSTLMPDTGFDTTETVYLREEGAEPKAIGVLDARTQEVEITAPPPASALAVFARYLVLGVEHIFIGYDHVAFILAVILWARHVLPLVKVVTSFTVAHSITLTLAALDLYTLPGWIVEPAIALTIVAVGAENFWSRSLKRRWIGTFALGLVHGFGFASVLRELGLPRDALAASLAGFNLGVEIGQIVIVSAAVPILLAIDRATARGGAEPRRSPALVYAASLVLMALGAWWFAERTLLA